MYYHYGLKILDSGYVRTRIYISSFKKFLPPLCAILFLCSYTDGCVLYSCEIQATTSLSPAKNKKGKKHINISSRWLVIIAAHSSYFHLAEIHVTTFCVLPLITPLQPRARRQAVEIPSSISQTWIPAWIPAHRIHLHQMINLHQMVHLHCHPRMSESREITNTIQ